MTNISLFQRNNPQPAEMGYIPDSTRAEVARGAGVIAAGYTVGTSAWVAAYEAFRYSVQPDVATTFHGTVAAVAGIVLTGIGLTLALAGYETGRDMITDAVD